MKVTQRIEHVQVYVHTSEATFPNKFLKEQKTKPASMAGCF